MEELSTKSPGSTLTAEEWNQLSEEMENIITSQGIALSNIDLFQASNSISKYSTDGDLYTAAGADVITLTGIAQPVSAYFDGMRIRFIATSDNTGAVTVNVNSLGAKALNIFPSNALTAGDLVTDEIYEMYFYSGSDRFILLIDNTDNIGIIQGSTEYWSQMESSTNGNDIFFDTGRCSDSTETFLINNSVTMIKNIKSNWVAGDGNGGKPAAVALAASQTLFCFSIAKPDGTADFGVDDNRSATNLLTTAVGYTFFRCIGAFLTTASSDVPVFIQYGDRFLNRQDFPLTSTSIQSETPTTIVLPMPLIEVTPKEVMVQMAFTNNDAVNQEKVMVSIFNPNDTPPTFASVGDNLQRFTDMIGKNSEMAGDEASTAGRLTVYPDEFMQVRYYLRSDNTLNADMLQTIDVVWWSVDRLTLTV